MKYVVTLNGKNYEVEVEETEAVITAITDAAPAAPVAAAPVSAPEAAPAAPAAPAAGPGVQVTAPMPGNILNVNITMGQAVKKGDVLFILEAMKMENDIVAPEDGVVKQILVQKGATVDTDAVLAVI